MIDVSFSPIKIAKGLIAIQKSKKDEENGPKLYAKISAENVDVKLQGYASLLGISAEVAIDITDDYMKFYTYGNLFNLFAANITVQARYKMIEEADFVVSFPFSVFGGNHVLSKYILKYRCIAIKCSKIMFKFGIFPSYKFQ